MNGVCNSHKADRNQVPTCEPKYQPGVLACHLGVHGTEVPMRSWRNPPVVAPQLVVYFIVFRSPLRITAITVATPEFQPNSYNLQVVTVPLP